MSEIILPSEVLPEIDWENPLNDDLVGLICVVGGQVVDLVSGTIATGSYVINTNNSWTGKADLDFQQLQIPMDIIGQTLSYVFHGLLPQNKVDNFVLVPSTLLDGNGYKLYTGARWTDSSPYADDITRSSTDVGEFITTSTYTTMGFELQHNTPSYGTNQWISLSTFSGSSKRYVSGFQATSPVSTWEKLEIGHADAELEIVPIYSESKTLEFYKDFSANPYQLFKTRKKESEEYGLQFDTTARQVSFPLVGVWAGVITYSDDTTLAVSGTDTYLLDNNTSIFIKYFKATESVRDFFWEFNQTYGDTVKCHYTGELATLVNFSADAGYVRGYGEIVGYQFDGSSYALTPNTTQFSGDFIYDVEFIVSKDIPNGFVLCEMDASNAYGFNLYATNDWGSGGGNLKIFSGDAIFSTGYIMSTGLPYRIKYERIGITSNFYINGVLFATKDNATQPPQLGTSTKLSFAANAGLSYKLPVTLLGFAYINGSNYDFTTGDSGKIIDTVGGNHAVITNASTDKWQPIVPVDVYTVGVGKDYADLALFNGVLSDPSVIYKCMVYGTLPDTSVIFTPNDMSIVFEAGDNVFDGSDFSQNYHFVNLGIRGYAGISFTYKGIRGSGFSTGDYGAIKEVIVDSCMFLNGKNNFISNGDMKVRVSGSHVQDNRSGFNNTATPLDTVITNSSLVNMGGYATSSGLRGAVQLVNVIGIQLDSYAYTSTSIFSTANIGSNNISRDTSATDAGIGTGSVDFAGAFVDEANNDYRINQAWADINLVGKGWNGSDICSSFYHTAVAIITAALSGTATSSSTEVDIVNGGKTLVVTLTGDTWLASGVDFDAQRQSIIDGFVSAQSETNGWNNEVTANESVTSVVRDSDAQITITLSAAIAYDITASETITATIPASALVNSGVAVETDVAFTIIPTATGFKIVWALANRNNNIIGV